MVERVRNQKLRKALTHGLAISLLGCSSILTGCGFGGVPINGGPTTLPASSDNWELIVTPSNGVAANRLSLLTGSILSNPSGSSKQAPAVFQATSGCYAAANVIPMDSTLTNSAFQGRSFGVQGQYLTMNGTLDSTRSSMTGTYQIDGGCSNGESGSFKGTRYRAFTGTYTGTVTQGNTTYTVSLQTVQGNATGVGNFIVTGTATLSGFSCISTASMPVGSAYVSGSSLALAAVSTSGVTLSLAGEIDPSATSLTSANLIVSGGACAGQYGPIKLNRT